MIVVGRGCDLTYDMVWNFFSFFSCHEYLEISSYESTVYHHEKANLLLTTDILGAIGAYLGP
jgi:hypothetical protein